MAPGIEDDAAVLEVGRSKFGERRDPDAENLSYAANGKVPSQIDGGLNCFDYSFGVLGRRMRDEIYLHLQVCAGVECLLDGDRRGAGRLTFTNRVGAGCLAPQACYK